MATNQTHYTCQVCKKLYRNPVVHRPCGFSFDRDCIRTGSVCPTEGCNQIIKEADLTVNYALVKIVDEYRLSVELPSTYTLILFDTSTSMWYSDSLLPFVYGQSRLKLGVEFLNEFFRLKMNSPTEKVSLVTFDTSPIQRFDFEAINKTHIEQLNTLTCDGTQTALFDSIDYCLEKLDQLKLILDNRMSISYLYVITDGGNNFGEKERDKTANILWKTKKLHISGHFIQLGQTNRSKTRRICEFIRYKYNQFNGGNTKDFVESFSRSINTETQARNIQNRSQNNTEEVLQMLNSLPGVPNTPLHDRVVVQEFA